MKVIQSLNQNALLVQNDLGEELVALGKGIGFGKSKGDRVETQRISKIFALQSTYQQQQLFQLIQGIDEQALVIAQDITLMAEKELGKNLVDTFVFTMAKHIQFLFERRHQESWPYDPFQYQLNYLYPAEYHIAVKTLRYVNSKYHLRLQRQEISFFTLHYVNGLIDNEDFHDVVQLSDLLNCILETIEAVTGKPLQRDTVEYGRFIVHMRYFVIRTLTGKPQPIREKDKLRPLLEATVHSFAREWRILSQLKKMLQAEFDLSFGWDEDLYLLLHLVRILGKEETV